MIAFAQMTDSPIDVSLVNRAIPDLVSTVSGRRLPPDLVLDTVSSYFGVDIHALKGRKRDKPTALARHVAMYLLREEAHLRLTTIGKALDGSLDRSDLTSRTAAAHMIHLLASENGGGLQYHKGADALVLGAVLPQGEGMIG